MFLITMVTLALICVSSVCTIPYSEKLAKQCVIACLILVFNHFDWCTFINATLTPCLVCIKIIFLVGFDISR